MRVTTRLVGIKPLLMHNIQLANPDNKWAKDIREITKRRKKTEEDRLEMSRLEWMGSLYVDNGRVVVPTGNVLKCFTESAKITKEGKTVTRALTALNLIEPLAYRGPIEIEDLWKDEQFRDMTMVAVQKQRILRTRPIFRGWGLQIQWELMTDVLDYDVFCTIVERAGRSEGLGDNRVNGYGRFEATVSAEAAVPERMAA